jgi:hypothetical protein
VAGYESLFPSQDDNILAGATSDTEKMFKIINGNAGLGLTAKLMKEIADLTAEIYKNMMGATGKGTSKLGMGEMPRFRDQFAGFSTGQKVAMGGVVAAGIGMGMMPNTGAAVTQRLAADAVAGISGINARQAILRSNRAVGNGATSAMGPTMATMSLMYGGGYTATSQTFKNVMPQVGGLSAITGSSNEQVAAGLAGVNAMRFLRIGVQARDSSGNLKPPNQIINDTYKFLYGGRKVTPEQAAMVLNPGSKGYATISAIAGGDPNLMNIIQMGVIARARSGSPLKKGDLGNAQKSLDLLGVGKESPLRANFNYNTSEARKLQATEKGLVGGYNTALNTTAAVNNGFSSLAEQADLLTQAFAGLRGVMQTLPGAGNTGAMIAGGAGGAAGLGMDLLQLKMMHSVLTRGPGGGVKGPGFLGGLMSKGGGLKGAGKLLGRGALAAGAYFGMEKLQGFLNKSNVPSWLRTGGNFMFDMGQGIATGAIAGGGAGAIIGGVAGTLGAATNPYGRGGDGCSHGNIGSHACGQGGDNPGMSNAVSPQQGFSGGNQDTKGMALQMPVPAGTPVTSNFGPRDNSKNPQISSNHRGIDYGVAVGTKIVAAANGIVTHAGLHRQYGNYIIIKHGKKSTLYGHLSKILVKVGQRVSAGEMIGKSGGKKGSPGAGTSTGPHLHFEVRDNGGPGAQGRENPKGWFGRLISTVSNLFKSVGRAIGIGDDAPSKNARVTPGAGLNFRGSSASVLSSIPLSESLSNALMSGGPIDFASFKNEFPQSAISRGVKGSNGDVYINNRIDKVSGDTVGMAGGNREGLIRMLHSAGFRGKGLETAFAVALAESGGRANAFNGKNRDLSYGLFQINMKDDDPASPNMGRNRRKQFGISNNKELFNAKKNAAAAFEVSNKGTWWKQWAAFTNGSFTKFLDDANTAARSAGIGGDNPGMAMETVNNMPQAMGRAGGGSVHATSNINVKVDMNVSVAKLGTFEVQRVASELRSAINNELKIKGIGGN